MKRNETLNSFLLRLSGIYRVFTFAAVFFAMAMANNAHGTKFTPFQIKYVIFLGLGSTLYFFLLFHPMILSILLAIEYFTVLYYAYVPPNLVYLELIWIPGVVAAMSLLLPKRKSVVAILCFGIIGPIFLSYGYIHDVRVSIGELTLPFFITSLFIYTPVTLLAILGSRISFQMETIKKQYVSLEFENKKINDINHAISQRIFNFQNDTTQKERNRLSKEIHDTAGYVFINLIMMLQATSAILYKDIKKAEKLVSDARDYAEMGINEIRHQLRNIRDYTPVSLSLQNEFYNVGESFQKATNVEINIEYGAWPKTLSKNLDSFFISFMQEALTNALKHGHATTVSVLCWTNKTHLGMNITDNGAGASLPIKKGIGITAMEDVANELEGSITIKTDKNGFRIAAAIPRAGANSALPETPAQ